MSIRVAARSFGTVLGGYVAMAITVIVGTFAAAAAFGLDTGDDPTPGYLVANIAVSFAAALIGGVVCARLAPSRPMAHVSVLAMIVAAVALAARSMAAQPGWYDTALAALGILGLLAGGAMHESILPERKKA